MNDQNLREKNGLEMRCNRRMLRAHWNDKIKNENISSRLKIVERYPEDKGLGRFKYKNENIRMKREG